EVGLKARLLASVVSEMLCGLPSALSLMFSDAVFTPGVCGATVRVTVQLAPTLSEEPQVEVCAYSPPFVPVMLMLVIEMLLAPTLVRVTVCGLLVCPTETMPKFRLEVETASELCRKTDTPSPNDPLATSILPSRLKSAATRPS